MLDREIIDRALRLLADILESGGAPVFQLVVCGGSSLIAMELVSRTTRDVDVLAFLLTGGLQFRQNGRFIIPLAKLWIAI